MDDEVGSRSAQTHWLAMSDAAALQLAALNRIVDAAAAAIRTRGTFSLVLSGGNTPRAVYRMLREIETDWSRWQIFFGDERCLPAHDPERNSRMAAEAWLDHVPIPAGQRHPIATELGAESAAQQYAQLLAHVGDFDLVLLGLGEDGHTASLFPGNDWGVDRDAPDVLIVANAPKPPPQRISLSAARLSRARAVLFFIEGESKRDAVQRWRRDADIPARAIRSNHGVDVMLEAQLLQ